MSSMTALTPLEPVAKLSPHVIRILGCNPGLMTLQGTNTYVVGNGPKRILIDTGERDKPEYIKLLFGVLKEENVGIEQIIITHWHHDHIGGLEDVAGLLKSDVTVWKYPRSEFAEDHDSCPIKIKNLNDGQKLCTDGATLRVIHSPGHTTDHICLRFEEENALFSGDSILGEGSSTFETLYDYMKSLEKLLPFKSSIIYPAHGPVIKNPQEKISEYIEHRNLRESQILNVLKNGDLTEPGELVKRLYKDTPALLLPAAERNVVHHLEKLQMEKRVVAEGDKWRLIGNGQSRI